MFYKKVKKILEEKGWNGRQTPSGLLDTWEGFVRECESGYGFGIYEFDNDLSVRDIIELILEKESLKSYADYREFKQNVFLIDKRFKKLLSGKFVRTEKENWWNRGILSAADGEYLEDIKDFYGFEVEKKCD